MHCTHAPTAVSHVGVAPEQSVFAAHCTQRLFASQTGVEVGHCDLLVQPARQVNVRVSQIGAAVVVHCALLVQPARQVFVRGSQTGAAVVVQSELATHATHVPVDTWQVGVVPEQSLLAAHCTHCCVVVVQIFAVAGQLLAVMQPTQAPVVVSQRVPMRQGDAPPSAVQAAWQVWLLG
jgi:hypothetical protein